MVRIGRTDSTWPNVGELRLVSMDAPLHGVEHVGRVQLSVTMRLPPIRRSRLNVALS